MTAGWNMLKLGGVNIMKNNIVAESQVIVPQGVY